MNTFLKKLPAVAAIAAAGVLALGSTTAQAQDKTITLCWAAWDPANALVELSKDFTAKTGIKMKFEFVPWPNFADRMLNELNSKGKLCDRGAYEFFVSLKPDGSAAWSRDIREGKLQLKQRDQRQAWLKKTTNNTSPSWDC